MERGPGKREREEGKHESRETEKHFQREVEEGATQLGSLREQWREQWREAGARTIESVLQIKDLLDQFRLGLILCLASLHTEKNGRRYREVKHRCIYFPMQQFNT